MVPAVTFPSISQAIREIIGLVEKFVRVFALHLRKMLRKPKWTLWLTQYVQKCIVVLNTCQI